MPVILSYTKLDGSEHKAGIDEEITKIGFNYDNMISIDLTGIEGCSNLQTLELKGNNLQSIDLAPLKSCTNLKTLELGGNNLQSIDLAPLKSCNTLQELWVVGHRLQTIDLSSLRYCNNLRTFGVGGSMIQNIDLAPLGFCISLSELRIGLTELQSIDVSPLSSCISLQKLRLGWNKLRSIDLSPLSSCANLQTLNLSKNELQSIDLDPLRLTTKLQVIDLSDNHLKRIDLSALSACTFLEDLSLEKNKLQSVDLIPLCSCTNMKTLDLSKNNLKSVELTPVYCTRDISFDSHCKGYSWLCPDKKENSEMVYDRPSSIFPWLALHHIAKKFGKDRRVQHDILVAMGLQKYGFIDHDLEDMFLSLPSHINTEEAIKQVTTRLVQEIAASVDRGGTTTGLRLEELLTLHGEIAIRTQEILEIRDSELRQVRVDEVDNKDELKKLWLTAYGYDVLTAVETNLETDAIDIEQIRNIFSDMGFELLGNNTSISGAKMDDMLEMVILWIVKNKNVQWSKIIPVDLSRWQEELYEKQLEELEIEEARRAFHREQEEEMRRFSEHEQGYSHVDQINDEVEDDADVFEEFDPEEEKILTKGKKLKRRERDKKKKEKSRKRVQWRNG